ncbi:MAG: fimbrillin family protein [Prevotella sp.]|nr:fimbrillin family protein [Prevotella sp.]
MKHILQTVFALCCLAACSEDTAFYTARDVQKRPLSLCATYPNALPTTRATIDGGFTDGDAMGIFVVDYDQEAGEYTAPETLAAESFRASNTRFTLQDGGTWQSPAIIYWSEKGTPADIYGYYPYLDQISSFTDLPFAVQVRQDADDNTTSATGYNDSDLLLAKQEKMFPTEEKVTLQFKHVMAGVTIKLEAGAGFSTDEWDSLNKNVLLHGIVTDGHVNLQTGETNIGNSAGKTIRPLHYADSWRAVVFPQTVKSGTALVGITIDGSNYELSINEDITFVSGKMHQLSVTVNRREGNGDFNLTLNVGNITPWQDDSRLHDGIVRQYFVVEVKNAGTLEQALKDMNLNAAELENMKVTGNINRKDLEYMGQQMPKLSMLSLQDAVINDGVLTGFIWHPSLTRIIFPERGLTTIDNEAFYECQHLTGSLIIPEGVTTVGNGAFFGCNFKGTLSLPSTLKHFGHGDIAVDVASGEFTGEFLLPEGIEIIRGIRGGRFSGVLHLPSSIKQFNVGGCWANMTGDLNIPGEIGIIADFAGGGFNGNLTIGEGITCIGGGAFRNTPICGEVTIPSSCTSIGSYAFQGTNISGIILSGNLEGMGYGCFSDTRISGTVTWPKKMVRVPDETFMGCERLSRIVLHDGVTIIDNRAFERCNNLLSIVCDSEEPPLVGNNAFLGVPIRDAIVEVPPQSVESYRKADGWSNFRHIVANHNFFTEPATVSALNKTHQENIVLFADGAWRTEHVPSWCQLSANSGTEKTELTVTIATLPHGSNARLDSIVFAMDVTNQLGQTQTYTTICKVQQYDYEYDEDSYITLQQSKKTDGIDIVFVGDGYDAETIAKGDYLDLIKYQTECFFAIEPYRSMREYFNVYATFALSQEKGINTMYTSVHNRFGTLNGVSDIQGCCTNSKIITNINDVLNYVTTHSPVGSNRLSRTLVILVPNTIDYGGNTIFILDENDRYLSSLSICPPSAKEYPNDTRGIIQHEAGGHGFGRLGDEEITKNSYISEIMIQQLRENQYLGLCTNLSISNKMHEVPWADFIFDTRYSNFVDVFEGGLGYSRGVWRPERNSCMGNSYIPYYNAPSRVAIWKRIKELAGENWTMEEFRAQDTFEWGPTTITVP